MQRPHYAMVSSFQFNLEVKETVLITFLHVQKKVRILQSYVGDLSEQNDILVKTVEELEKEANERVIILETRLLQGQKVRCEMCRD